MSKNDTSHTIIRSAKHFFSGTLLSRISGLGREVLMAIFFGANAFVAAFWMAFRFANILRRLFGEGALQSSFIPHFESLRKEDPVQAKKFFRDLLLNLTFLLLLIIFIGELVLSFSYSLVSEENHSVITLTQLLLPGLLFICLFALNMGFLHCEQRYFITGVAPAIFNVLWIIGIFLWKGYELLLALEFLSITVVVGLFLQWLFTVPALLQFFKGFPFLKNIQLWSPELKKLKKYLFLSILGVGAMQINSALDVIFARIADAAGPAYLAYALRLEQVPTALFGVTLATALLPPLSRAAKAEKWGEFHQFLSFSIQRSMGLMIPCFFGVILTAVWAVNLIYGHGDFSILATQETALCLIAYGFGLFPMTIVFLLASSCFACKNFKYPAIISVFTLIINVSLNAIFVLVLGWGCVSVAIATSIGAMANAFLLYLGTYRKKDDSTIQGVWKGGIKTVFVSFMALLFAACLSKVTHSQVYFWDLLVGEEPLLSRNFSVQLRDFFLPTLYYLVSLFVFAKLFKVDSITHWWQKKKPSFI